METKGAYSTIKEYRGGIKGTKAMEEKKGHVEKKGVDSAKGEIKSWEEKKRITREK